MKANKEKEKAEAANTSGKPETATEKKEKPQGMTAMMVAMGQAPKRI